MEVSEMKVLMFLFLASSGSSAPFANQICKDLADGIRKEYDFEDVNECYECDWTAMGMQDFTIADDSIFSTTGDPQMSRLGNPDGAWCASGNPDDYIEVNIGDKEVKFGGFDIQGYGSSWITVFKVSYKDASGVYKFVNDEEGNEVLFDGNSDAELVVKCPLEIPVYATSVRLHPVANKNQACLRFELFSCTKDEPAALSSPVFKSESRALPTDGKFESDIELNYETRMALKDVLGIPAESDQTVQRGASVGISRWTDYKSGNDFLVPYTISSGFSSYDTGVIESAINMIAKSTCVKLVKRGSQPYYIRFQRGSGCSSPVGKSPYAPNQVSLGRGCVYAGTVAHEILHSLGFWHEQSRPDRDEYVIIQWQNIVRGMEYNFRKRTKQEIDSFGSPYDLGSIMHYHTTAFTSNGRPTIVDKKYQQIKTQRTKLSQEDINQINQMYSCKNTGSKYTTTAKPLPPTTKASTCVDERSSCEYWSRKGYCKSSSKYANYMKKNCEKSCDLCTAGCKDLNESCPGWSDYCNDPRYVKYMQKNCPATCGKC